MDTRFSSLPDYPALKKLASALWQQDNTYHGAAIMIGAGFSRTAASTGDGHKRLPLWDDFSKTLAKELESESKDPLRLAEEYNAYFGKQALHDLIKREINDAAWKPGKLHNSLLELPWTEVLTTNWDTLLERASLEVHDPVYCVVSKQEDLSNARSPRIVKLHGTVDVTNELVFTQEDYRKYPHRHAAFVNFSRQVFIENELCLLGFSGDDPNFLQWAGWVRDNLADHSRRIYLVGPLHLNAAKRKYLESINVAPIDLGNLVADYDDQDTKHLEATKLFIQYLLDMKPNQAWEWSPANLYRGKLTEEERKKSYNDSTFSAKLLEEQLPWLNEDRISYPGWLICPHQTRWELQNQICTPWPTQKHLSHMTTDSRMRLFYEITWLHDKTYEVMPSWLAQELLAICDPAKPCVLSKKQQLEIALLLLKNTLWMNDDEAEDIAQITSTILENGVKHWPESIIELTYHRAIVARDKFDYPTLEKCVDKITSLDPVWKLRKASLLAELGNFNNGEILVAEAYRELLGQYRHNRNSLYVLSRLAWAHWFIRGIDSWSSTNKYEAFPSYYKEPKCHPWDHIENIKDRITKELDKQQKKQEIEPLFEPGYYKDNSNQVNLSNELHPLLLLDAISTTAGLPLRWKHVSFLVEQAAKIAEMEDIDNVHRFRLAIRAANSDTADVLNKVFSRINIACIPQDDVDVLLKQCRKAIEYWSEKLTINTVDTRSYALDRLRVFIEVMARASVRATPEQAKHIFQLALSLCKKNEFHHFWLFDALNHLTEFALDSIPHSQHSDILLDALLFPLRSEIHITGHKEWINPIINHPGDRQQNPALDRRIAEIIDYIVPCSSQSAPALLRILPLIEKGFLTQEELNKVEKNVWGPNPDYQTLPETGLFKYILLKISTQKISAVKKLVRKYLFESKGDALFDQELLSNIANSAILKNIQEYPTAEQAVDYFNRMVVWRKKESDNVLNFMQPDNGLKAKLIAKALARSVVPALPSSELTKENFQKLFTFYEEVKTPEILIACSYFATANESVAEHLEKVLRQNLQAKDTNTVACASYALLAWRDQTESPAVERLILRLMFIIGPNRIIGLHALLWTVNEMLSKTYLSEENIVSLIESLPAIFDSTSYININSSSRESVSISFVRAACARLAKNILSIKEEKDGELLRILEEAEQDTLPEVKFAHVNYL